LSEKYRIKNKRRVLIIISIVVLILGVAITPFIPIVYGIGLLYLLWSETGGMSYGNPYKKKMIEEKRSPLTKAAYSPIKDVKPSETSDPAYFWLAILGFGNVNYQPLKELAFVARAGSLPRGPCT